MVLYSIIKPYNSYLW